MGVLTTAGATPWPTVTSVTPRFVSQIGGEDLTMTGAGFREGAYVDVAGIPCSNIEVSVSVIADALLLSRFFVSGVS